MIPFDQISTIGQTVIFMSKQERQTRILNAAVELFIHYGYDKTTVSDIARQAGISKGAIYLHFNSKDQLMETLLTRELMTYHEKWMSLIEEDPQGGTIGGMYKNILLAFGSSPFVAAIFRQDSRVLGSYLHKPDSFFRRRQRGTQFEFVQLMQEAGVIRPEVDSKVIAYIMSMLSFALVAMDDLIDPQTAPPLDDLIHGIADLMDRALTPKSGGDSEAGKNILRQLSETRRRALEEETS